MRMQVVLLFVGLFCTNIFAVAEERTPNDTSNLQGTWQVIVLEANGEKKPADEAQELKIVVKDNEMWVVRPSGADPKLQFRLAPQKAPAAIDLVVQEGQDKGKIVPGIYRLRQDQLRLCINIFGDPSFRPREFTTQDHDGVVFAILEREKSK